MSTPPAEEALPEVLVAATLTEQAGRSRSFGFEESPDTTEQGAG